MSRITRFTALFAAVVMAASTLSAAPASAASILKPRGQMITTEAPDFASVSFSDSWDFNGEHDLPHVDGLSHTRFTNVRIENGVWKGTGQNQAHLRLLQSWNSLPNGRDGELHPIDADRFTRLSFRMRLTGHDRSAAEVSWYDCGMLRPECKGGVGFWVDSGWNTYDIELVNDPAKGPVDWEGEIRGLVLTPSAKGGEIEIDWIRLYEPSTNGMRYRSFDTHPDTQLIWDRDRHAGNNNHRNPNWGVIADIGQEGHIAWWDTDALPPGKYFVYTLSPNGKSGVRRLVINQRPRPVIFEPNLQGGLSYDLAVRGNAWDFNAANDVGLTRNMTYSIANGTLIGTNTAPNRSDSGFRLAIPADKPIDAERFHRFTARVYYEGGFSLSGGPGGGMNARLVWRKAGGGLGDFKVSDDIVVYPGWNTISIDLNDYTPNELVEGGSTTGWEGNIGLLRFDAHEDSGTRRFHVDYVMMSEDDKPTNGTFDVTFRDRGFEKGTTANIYIDRNADGVGGQLIGSVTVARGTNTFTWNVPQNRVGSGEWHVVVEMIDRHEQTQTTVSTGTLTL
ncbi:MAG: hypothetical protein ACR2P0_11325 [Acidimicrobiales bacterium]